MASDQAVIVGGAWTGGERYGENTRTVNVGSRCVSSPEFADWKKS